MSKSTDSREFLEVMCRQQKLDAANKTWQAGKCPHLEEIQPATNENEGHALFEEKKMTQTV